MKLNGLTGRAARNARQRLTSIGVLPINSVMPININQLVATVAEIANGNAPTTPIDSYCAIALVLLKMEARTAWIGQELPKTIINTILNIRSQLGIGSQEPIRADDLHQRC